MSKFQHDLYMPKSVNKIVDAVQDGFLSQDYFVDPFIPSGIDKILLVNYKYISSINCILIVLYIYTSYK